MAESLSLSVILFSHAAQSREILVMSVVAAPLNLNTMALLLQFYALYVTSSYGILPDLAILLAAR